MNRSLLLVICDFLLLSLLALARFDDPSVVEQQEEPRPPPIEEAVTDDLVAVLRQSLEAEQVEREQMASELDERARALAEERRRAEELTRRQSVLEGEQERLERLRQQLEQERTKLTSEVASTREQLQMTAEERTQLRESIAAAQERQRLLQEQLQAREQALEAARQQQVEIQQQRETSERERAILATRLESAQVAQQRMETEITTLRTERQAAQQQAAELAQNVGQLAEAQKTVKQEIAQEIRQATPLSSNEIYDRFLKSRVPAGFTSAEAALLGDITRTYTPFSVAVEGADGKVYTLFEASETPFRPSDLDQLRSVTGQLQVGRQRINVPEVSFLGADPRIVAVAIPRETIEAAGIEPYKLEQNPMRFQEVVVVQASGDKYGEAGAKLDPTVQGYINIPSSATSRLFGSFTPSRGDLVFSRSGDLIGFMVSNGRAVILRNTRVTATLPIGASFSRSTAESLEPVLEATIPAEAR